MLAKNENSGNQKPKRIVDNVYRLKFRKKLFCPHCKLLCKCGSTRRDDKGRKVQYRYCSNCNHSVQIRLKKADTKAQ